MRLEVITGDFTTKDLRSFVTDVDRPPTTATIRFVQDRIARIPIDEWPALLQQITVGELVKRRFPGAKIDPPLGNPDVLSVVKQIDSTPSYQLLLAGFDIAERIELASGSSPEMVQRRFEIIHGWMPSFTGRGGLFFVPHHVTKNRAAAIDQLLVNNKLCSANLTLNCGRPMTRYYVPYATPMGFVVSKVDADASALWDQVRSLYDMAEQATV